MKLLVLGVMGQLMLFNLILFLVILVSKVSVNKYFIIYQESKKRKKKRTSLRVLVIVHMVFFVIHL